MLRVYSFALMVLVIVWPASASAQEDPFSLDPEVLEEEDVSEKLPEIYTIGSDPHVKTKKEVFTPAGGDSAKQKNVQDESRVYSGAVERLLNMAGESTKVSPDGSWSDFEEPPDRATLEKYGTVRRWQMEKEIRKPLPQKDDYKLSLDQLDHHLRNIKLHKSDKDKPYFLRDTFGGN